MKNSQVSSQIHSIRNNHMLNLGGNRIQICTTFPIHPSICHQRQFSHIENNPHSNGGSSFVVDNPKGLITQRVAFIPDNQKINELLKVAAPTNICIQQSEGQVKQKKSDRPLKDKRFFQWMQKPKKQFAVPKAKDQKEGYENSKNSKQCPITSDTRFLETKKNPIQNLSKNVHPSIANLNQKEAQNTDIIHNGNCEKIKSAINIGVQIQKQFFSNKLNLIEAKRQQLLRDLTYQRETRGKKAIFKTPAFLLDKANILPLTKTIKQNQKLSQSTPKTFKTQQQICFSQKFSFKQKMPQCEVGRFQNGGSSEKNIRVSSHRLNKKLSFLTSSNNIPKVLDIGAQLKLKRVTNCNDLGFVELKVIKILADNDGSSTYLVLEKATSFIYCLKKNEIKHRNETIQPHQISNMIRQSKIGMLMQNSFLVKTYCTLFDEKNIYQLMQYAPSSTLHSHNKKQNISKTWKKQLGHQDSHGLHELTHIKQILFQLLQGVSYMHKLGITHRDLKPANIFLSNTHAFKIGDFGCSIYNSPEDYVGTLDYAAPQIMMHHTHGPAVDMWAIGCIAYELFTGQPPFFHPGREETIERIVECNYDINRIKNNLLKDFILKLLIKQPTQRISSISAQEHPLFASP